MTRSGAVDGRQFLDCPTAGPQDVTAEWRNPSRLGGSWIQAGEAAEYLGMDWPTFQRAAEPVLGYADTVDPFGMVRVLVCHGCGAVVRVWLKGRPVSVPHEGVMGVPIHRRRAIDVAVGAGAKRGRCGGACLGGKRSCDCQCGGYCHGAGTCRCAERLAAMSPSERIAALAAR